MRVPLEKNDTATPDGVPGTRRGAALLLLLFCCAATAAPPDDPDKPAASTPRLTPEVLVPNESRVALVRLRMPALVFDPKYTYLQILKQTPNDGHKVDEDYAIEWIQMDKVKDLQGLKPAQQLYPLRAAEIVAAFPLKAQVQEFQDKLHLKSNAAVLAEKSQEAGEDPALPAFRFLGVRVERREVRGQGAAAADWAPLDVQGAYLALFTLCGKRQMEEAAWLKPAVFPGLVTPKLPTFGDLRVPPLDEYPKLEEELKTLKAALKVRNHGPGDAKPVEEPTIPDACLVRLFDMTVEPGKTYEYRLQVRMANPNLGRSDTAAQVDTKDQELSVKDWYVLPQKLAVPTDLHLYAVDQRAIDLKGIEEIGDGQEPALPRGQEQAVLQIQEWVDYVHTRSRLFRNHMDISVGDWVIAERVVATRGELIGRQRVEMPCWRMTLDRFTMASDLAPPRGGDTKKIRATLEVPFFHDGREPILVDFCGGEMLYSRALPKANGAAAPPVVLDHAPEEVLLYTADGRLIAHSSAVDAADPDRMQRLENVRDWIRKVKSPSVGK